MESENSVVLMQRFQQGDDAAAEQLFAKYFVRLDRFAERQMSGRLQQRLGSDDIAQSVYRSFFLKAQQGVYEFSESGELWRLLAFLAKRKVQRNAEWHSAQKRDPKKEQPINSGQEKDVSTDDQEPLRRAEIDDAIEYVLSRVSPSWQAILNAAEDELDVSGIALKVGESDTDVRKVLILRMRCASGLDNEQVAEILGCSEVTVRRIWRNLLQFAEELKAAV